MIQLIMFGQNNKSFNVLFCILLHNVKCLFQIFIKNNKFQLEIKIIIIILRCVLMIILGVKIVLVIYVILIQN